MKIEPERSWWTQASQNLFQRLVFMLVLAGVFGWLADWLIAGFPSEIKVFAGLITVSIYLIAGGFVILIFIIPVSGPCSEIKTEFYSARAAYFCTIAGLVLAIVVSMGLIVALEMGGPNVLGAK